ncbi:MAG: ACP S-malonyltransferase [Pseudomonadota bacterium]
MRKIAFLFPGQGSQFAGMGKDLYLKRPGIRSIFETASKVTGLDVESLCFDGPLERLTETVNLQPAITTVNLSCLAVFREEGIAPDIVAGHSLGEYSALCAAGVISFEDTFRLVSERGKLMQREAERHPGGMLAAVGLDIESTRNLLDKVKTEGVCAVANHNAEKQIVITGERKALEAVSGLISANGGKAIPLNVSGPWHSPLMQGAADSFRSFLREINLSNPSIPVLFNVTGLQIWDPEEIREIMSRQICSSVLWYDTMRRMIAGGVSDFVEVGPKKVLTGLLKKTLPAGGDFRLHQADELDGLLTIASRIKALGACHEIT